MCKVTPGPYLYQYQALERKQDKRVWQLQSRSAEKNFSFQISISLKHGLVKTLYCSPFAVSLALSLTIGCNWCKQKILQALHWPTAFWTMVFFRKTDDARFSPTARPTCPPSCSNTPEKQLRNVKYCAWPQSRRVQWVWGLRETMMARQYVTVH